MNEFHTRIMQTSDKDTARYEITFSTDDRRYFDRVEETCRACIDEPTIKEAPLDKVVPKEDKTFDIVDAFMHLIWGRKVRMTHWDKDEYIVLKDCNLQIGEKWIIRNDGKLYPAEKLFDKDNIEARWEDYKEEEVNG